ncbi:MAG: hypothetical protein J7604_10055 [Sporocytophaga sp.]|uniref:hypothetical protein n=1 Tax=Sporocytophaga sp. TaxID=2231183 RepID=UPI001B0EEA6F|nr:hypothetical protein [Sporocytophaga sp.]MBO9700540.1 hypothetical protein [Sporocytophaga sp.]
MKNFNLSPKSKDDISDLVRMLQEDIIPKYNYLREIDFPSEQELEEIKGLKEMWELIQPIIESYTYALQNSLLQTSKDIFINAKLEAEKGNKEAEMFYEKLKDSYKAMVEEELSEQSN